MQMQIFSICFQVLNSGDIVHHVQQHFQFRFQLRHYSLQPYQKPQARQLRQPEQNIQVLPVLIYTFMELRVGISQAAIEQWGINSAGNNGSEGESGWYAFPVNFNSACFALFCGLRNTDTNNPTNYDSEVQPRNWTTSKFNVYKQDYGGNPWFGSFIWFAIGRQPASYKL